MADTTQADPHASELDPHWPPFPPPTGPGAKRLQNLIRNRPDTFFGTLRTVRPIFKAPGAQGPVFITRFRDVQEVLSRPEVFTVKTYQPMMDPGIGPFMLSRDGTAYNQRDKGIMRSLIQQKDLPAVRKTVTQLAEQCIDEGHEDGTLEVVGQLSRRVPILLTGAYFGFPGPDLSSMFRWSRATQHDMFHNQELDGKIHDDNLRAGREMRTYLQERLIPQRRRELNENPERDDVVSRLLKTELPPEIGFDESRLLSNIMGLLVGGVETTSQAIVQLLDQLFRRPKELKGAQKAAREDRDELLSRYCWEALRFNPINPLVTRRCVQEYRIAAGTVRTRKIETGKVVLVCTRSAMKDGRELPRPRKFRLDRPPHHYMHFGYGAHTCLGDHVSRVQIPEIVKRLLLRENLRRAPGPAGKIDYRGGPFPESFSVTFDT